MLKWLGKLTKKVGLILLVLVAAYTGWRWGPEVFPRVNEWLGIREAAEAKSPVATPELADSVVARVQDLRRGEGGGLLALGDDELTSVLRYATGGFIPDGVTEPEVRLREGRVHFRAQVALSSFPDLPDLGPVIGLLPDTLEVALEASMTPFGEGTATLLVHRIEASRIPLPGRLIPEILTAMGRSDEPGLPPEGLLVPLPSGLASAYILTDSLILSHDL